MINKDEFNTIMLIIVKYDDLTMNIDELDTILIIVIRFHVRLLYTKIINIVSMYLSTIGLVISYGVTIGTIILNISLHIINLIQYK